MSTEFELFCRQVHQDVVEDFGSDPRGVIYGVAATSFSIMELESLIESVETLRHSSGSKPFADACGAHADYAFIEHSTQERDIEIFLEVLQRLIQEERDTPLPRDSVEGFRRELSKRIKRLVRPS